MLLSRVAEAVYWAGRYLERVEDMARVVQVHGETHIDLPVGADVGWGPLLDICGADKASVEGLRRPVRGQTSTDGGPRVSESAVVAFVVTDRDNPSSIMSALEAARDNLRVARPVVPREVWELINDLWLAQSTDAEQMHTREGRVRWLRRAIDECTRMNGVLASTMRRDEAMAFLSIGQQIERADITGRILTVRADSAAPSGGRDPYDEVHWMALLRSVAAYQPFRRAMPARPDNGATLRFLLQDDSFPRAVSSCLSELRSTVKRLPGNEEVLAVCADASVLVADAPVDRLTPAELRSLVDDLQGALVAIHGHLEATYFRSTPTMIPEPTRDRRLRSVGAVGHGAGVEGGDALGGDATTSDGRLYRVSHRTTYEYDGPVEQSYNEAHLRPRTTERQRCTGHTLAIEPGPTSRSEYVDAFGNAVSIFVVAGGFERLAVTATSEVTVHPVPPPPPSPPWESALWLLDIDRQADSRQARQYRAPSRLVPASPDLGQYAQSSFEPGRPLVEAVVDLAGRIYRDFVYEPGFTSVTTPVLDVLRYRRGVCQDFAHLGVGCVRSMGLAARYVSGYIETVAPAGQARLVGADASHAWFSVYLPGWGWIDVDPTNDQLVSDSYITTAWGRDYWDVSPLRGSVEGGGTSHTLDVAVDVTRLGVVPPVVGSGQAAEDG
jgi:uncharacterized alpha-E superfamily protein/transglutaminase-like putative cysteine protease